MSRKRKKNYDFFFRYGLQKKMVIIYFSMSVLPILLVSLLAYFFYYRSALKEAYSLVEQNSVQYETVVSDRLSTYQNILYEIVVDNKVIRLSENINSGSNENDNLVSKYSMDSIMRNYVYTYDAIRSIAFLTSGDSNVCYSKWYSGISGTMWYQEEVRKEMYAKMNATGKIVYATGINLANDRSRPDYVILMGIPVRNLLTKKQAGVMILALDDNILNFDGKSNRLEKKERSKTGVSTIVMDQGGKLIKGDNVSDVNKTYSQYREERFGDKKNIYELRDRIPLTEWQIVNIIDQDKYLKDIHIFAWVVVALTIAITLLFFVIQYIVFQKYIGTIREISRGIGQYMGKPGKEVRVNIDNKDELYIIVNQFNEMTFRVNELVDTLKRKNEEIKEAVNRRKHAEIKALEAQINPHFLFNTLDSINWRAIEHEEEEISNMLGTLGSLLRYSVSNIDMVVVLEAEISWLRKYIFLQRDRFQYSFDCEYDMEDRALAFPIYKMLLQPIIENTILHAFQDVKTGGMIYIKAYLQEEDTLYISIRDNGSGMKKDKLQMIQQAITDNAPLNCDSIGISNVINRLELYYHGKASISVQSKWGEGTEFVLVIPRAEDEFSIC